MVGTRIIFSHRAETNCCEIKFMEHLKHWASGRKSKSGTDLSPGDVSWFVEGKFDGQ